MSITIYDAIMLVVIIGMMIQGAYRGMIWQIAPIVSLVLGYIVAYPMSITAAPYFGQPPLNQLWAMIVIYAAVSLAVYLFMRSLRESFDRLKLTEFDRHLGGLLGLVKGGLIAIVVTIGLISVSPQARELILKSESSTIAARTVNTISPILPDALNALIRPYVQHLNDQLPPDERNQGWPIVNPRSTITRSTRTIARKEGLARPTRFDDEDGYVPPIRDEEPVAPVTPRRTSSGTASRLRTQPEPTRDSLDEGLFPTLEPTTRPKSRTVPPPRDEDFPAFDPQPTRTEAPRNPRPTQTPPAFPNDDFFSSDPDTAVSPKARQPR
ncbi:MAG TPA: CvpA family protein [Planctomycetaceae bacterium]|nr:CvpA family protein [Planctomycetaceae bacterium]